MLAQPQPKGAKYVFTSDVNILQTSSPEYEGWAAWRDSMEATFRAFIRDNHAAKMAWEYRIMLMKRGLNQVGVDVAVQWVSPGQETHETLLAMVL